MSPVTTLPWSRPLTADAYFAMDTPDDGRRYELIDGVVVVSPSPLLPHQWVSTQLIVILAAACPPHLRVFHAPLDVRLANDTVAQPDVLVVRREDADGTRLVGVPILAVEILSDSTRGNDLLLKRSRYARSGVQHYWIVDPQTCEMVVWQLDTSGEYTEVAHADLGADPLSLDKPFPVTLTLTP